MDREENVAVSPKKKEIFVISLHSTIFAIFMALLRHRYFVLAVRQYTHVPILCSDSRLAHISS